MCLPLFLPWAAKLQAMGKTSTNVGFNLPGKPAWVIAELVGPLNLLFVILTLPGKLKPSPTATSSFLGTGLPAQNELIALLYFLHYANRAIINPIILNPSMSPMAWYIPIMMMVFQFTNSSNIGAWLVYSTRDQPERSLLSPLAIVGLALYFIGLAGNIQAETSLFSLRRGAAKRKAKSEGKAVITYSKVYSIPPAEGLFKYILYPHYTLEWLEWTGYALLGYAYGLGTDTPATWFVINEVASMLPRAINGRRWYVQRFGKRAVGERGGALPLTWL